MVPLEAPLLVTPSIRLFESVPPFDVLIKKNGCPGAFTSKLIVSPTLAVIDGSFPDTLPFWSVPDNE